MEPIEIFSHAFNALSLLLQACNLLFSYTRYRARGSVISTVIQRSWLLACSLNFLLVVGLFGYMKDDLFGRVSTKIAFVLVACMAAPGIVAVYYRFAIFQSAFAPYTLKAVKFGLWAHLLLHITLTWPTIAILVRPSIYNYSEVLVAWYEKGLLVSVVGTVQLLCVLEFMRNCLCISHLYLSARQSAYVIVDLFFCILIIFAVHRTRGGVLSIMQMTRQKLEQGEHDPGFAKTRRLEFGLLLAMFVNIFIDVFAICVASGLELFALRSIQTVVLRELQRMVLCSIVFHAGVQNAFFWIIPQLLKQDAKQSTSYKMDGIVHANTLSTMSKRAHMDCRAQTESFDTSGANLSEKRAPTTRSNRLSDDTNSGVALQGTSSENAGSSTSRATIELRPPTPKGRVSISGPSGPSAVNTTTDGSRNA